MSRDCKINNNRWVTTLPEECSLRLIVLACILFVLTTAATSFAKGGDLLTNFPVVDSRAAWQKAAAMAVDSAGNIIVVGDMDNGSNKDYQLVKFKADGTGLAAWAPVSYGHGTADNDIATAVAVDADDNIIVTGTVWNGTNNDIHTIKYDGASGAVIWQHTYDSGGADTATAITVDSSKNIYVAGSAFNDVKRDDYLIIKYPSAGAVPTWVELYDDTDVPNPNPNYDNRIMSISAGSDGIAVTGYTHTGGLHFDILTRKYGFDKSLVRSWRYSSAGNREDRGVAVKMDSSGNVIATGYVTNASNNKDLFTQKYNPGSDTPQWSAIHDGNGNDEPKGLWVDSSGDVYVAGTTTTLSGNEDFITFHYSGAGAELWSSILDAGGGSTDIPVGIVVDDAADGGVFVSGYSTLSGNDDFLTVKYKKDNGTLLWEHNWNGSGNNHDRPVGIALDPVTRAVSAAGWTFSAANNYDFAAIKYDFGPLNAPNGLTATAASNTSISLAWLDNSSNEDRFYIQRKLGEGGTFADITTVPATLPANTVTYADTGLTANNYYYYRVRAYNAANGDSHYSNEARALTKVVSYDSPVWKHLYASPGGKKDIATAVTVGSDDHPVVTGYSELEEGTSGLYSFDYLTIKVDRANDLTLKWKARYDSGDGGTDMASGVALDSSGNVLVTGNSWLSSGGDSSDELYTRKVATAGLNDPLAIPDFVWEDQYGTQAGIDLATAIAMAEDGSNNSVVVGYGAGSGSDDIFIIKYAADGSRAWTPIVYDSGRHDHPTALALDAAGNIFVTGYSFNMDSAPSSYDWFTAKYNGATGALVWSETYNVSNVTFGGVDRADLALSIDTDSTGNAYVTGYATNSAGNTVMYTVKYDGAASPAGNRRIWEKFFNYSGYDAEGVSVKVDPIDGAVVVAGDSYVSATDSDLHLIRYNSADGAVVWERNFDLPAKYDYLAAMTMDSSGYLYLAGNSRSGHDTDAASDDSSDVMSLIYDHEGTFLGAMTYNGAAGKQDQAAAITVNYQGEAFVAGFTKSAASDEDYLVFKQKNNYILVPAPLGLTPQADYGKVDLTWRENTPSTSFRIERTLGPATPLSVWSLVTTKSSGTLAHTDTGLAAGVNYCYRVDAYSGSLNSRKLEKCVTTTLAAAALSPLTVDSATQITLNWSQVTGNTGYKIQRKITAGGTWADLTTKSAGQNSHVDTGLTPGTVYYYRVYTNSPSGYSLSSNEQNSITKPAAPAMAANGAITSNSVVINWADVAGETGYKIDRKEGGSWTLNIATVGQNVITYTDAGRATNTQYYYRIRAYNASGDSDYSGEQGALTSFTSTTLSSAAGVSQTQVDLTWTDVAGETSYSIQESACNYNNNANDISYCTSAYLNNASYWSAWTTIYTTPAADVLTYSRTGRTSGYAYAYRIIANTSGNSSAPSNGIIAWAQMTKPTLTITPASETSLTTTWNDIPAATNYTLERKLTSGGTFAEVTGAIGLAYNTTSYLDSGLALSTQYCYRVKGYSTLPNNPPAVYSDEKCLFTPLAAPLLADPIVVSTTQIDLAWNNVTGNTGYELQRCYTNYPNNPEYLGYYGNNPANDGWFWTCSAIIALPQDTVSYSNTGLLSGYTYRFKVRDTYSGGTSAYSAPKDTTIKPSAPALSATPASTTQMNLSWNDVYGDTGYKLEWKPRSGADCTAGSWSAPITMGQNVTTYQQTTGLTASTYYCYRIKAYNSYTESAYSGEVSQTTQLDPPTLNALSGVTASKIDVDWNQVSGNTGYKVERKTGALGNWSQVGTVAQNVINFSNNSGLSPGTLYYYRVSVQNVGGYSLPSNEVSATTTPVAPTVTATPVSDDRIDLTWTVKLGATHYKIERKEGAGAYSLIDTVAADYVQKYCGYDYPTVACPSLSDVGAGYQSTGLTENTNYCYRVTSWNSSGGDSAYSTEKCTTTFAVAIQNLSAAAVNSTKIRLDWTPVACIPIACDNPDGFEIERQIRQGIWVKLATVNGSTLTYTDTLAIDPNKQYSYRIKTFKGADKSPYSNIATVTTPLYATSPPSCP